VTTKSLTKPTTLFNPPKPETVDEEGMALLDQLKGGGRDQGSGQGSNKQGGRKKRSKKSSKSVRSKSSKSKGGSHSNRDSNSSTSSSLSSNLSTGGPNLSSKEVAPALVQNINAITVRQLEERDRERKNALMLSTLGSESQNLFILLSAKGWNDTKPKVNSFMKELFSDK
jgi:hypothetical protein